MTADRGRGLTPDIQWVDGVGRDQYGGEYRVVETADGCWSVWVKGTWLLARSEDYEAVALRHCQRMAMTGGPKLRVDRAGHGVRPQRVETP